MCSALKRNNILKTRQKQNKTKKTTVDSMELGNINILYPYVQRSYKYHSLICVSFFLASLHESPDQLLKKKLSVSESQEPVKDQMYNRYLNIPNKRGGRKQGRTKYFKK